MLRPLSHKAALLATVAQLQRHADAYPINTCNPAPEARHRLILGDDTLICFTRNRDNNGEAYYLSVRGPKRKPTDSEFRQLTALFFDPRRPIEELSDILTPDVRAARQTLSSLTPSPRVA